jgi:hypothetical protein
MFKLNATRLLLALNLVVMIALASGAAVAYAKVSKANRVAGINGNYRSRSMSNDWGGNVTEYRWKYTDGLECVGTDKGGSTCDWDGYHEYKRSR